MTDKEHASNNEDKENTEEVKTSENPFADSSVSTSATPSATPSIGDEAISQDEEKKYLEMIENEKQEFHGFLTPEDIQALRDKHTNHTPSSPEESKEEKKEETKEEKTLDAEKNSKKTSAEEKTALVKNKNSQIAKKENKEEVFKEEEAPMTLLEHLKEFRKRLTRIVVIVFIGFFVCYNFAELAYNFLADPLKAAMPEGSSLIYTSPPGAFFVYLKVSLVLSFFATSPYSFYQIWAFIAPGLYKEEKKMLMPLSFFSAFFFISGATFCYYLVFPIAFQFFMGFATDAIVPMISIEEYLSFVLKLLIAFGLVFEMPLFAFFLARLGLLTAQRMRSWRKYAILVIFITAAILTPPDIFSQLLMALPMLVLYEVSVLIAAIVAKKKVEENAENAEDAEEDEANQSSNTSPEDPNNADAHEVDNTKPASK